MNLAARIEWATRLGEHLLSDHPDWLEAREQAFQANPWFIPEFIAASTQRMARSYLQEANLKQWAESALVPEETIAPAQVGLVMAGNLPLVGFHDWLAVFISGHHAHIKRSSQDTILLEYIRTWLVHRNPNLAPYLQFADRLNGMDAYIATGSDNTSRYFDYYFGKYPHIIRKNRTSAALLTGSESADELTRLSDDLYLYFGRGCRNVTQLLVPRGYDFLPLLESAGAYRFLSDHNKYQNNFEYQLALRILNKEYYMTNQIALFVENPAPYSPISVVHYTYYDRVEEAEQRLNEAADQIQCRIGSGGLPFGAAQLPGLADYADGVNTLDFLQSLPAGKTGR